MLNGNIAGTKWRSRGDGQQGAYGYTYDPANRILGADFTEGSGNVYANNPKIDFDMVLGDGINGSDAYDANGNIKKMKHQGMKGIGGSTTIDDMTYLYYDNGNKLRSVSEAGPFIDHKLGDFTDKNSGDDYGYDRNGNLITDLNKKIGSNTGEFATSDGAFKYNHLNLPSVITIKDDNNPSLVKGTITYIYDAAGNKLEKRVHENASAANNNKVRDIFTTYLGGFNYETKTVDQPDAANPNYQDKLMFFAQEEGRVRVEHPLNGDPLFHYDYFVKDHLGNVRMVLTDEQQQTPYLASMESAVRVNEEKVFKNIGTSAYPAGNIPGGYPADATTNPNDFVARLNGSGNKVGPSLVLKVMREDKLNIAVKSFFRPHGPTTATNNPFNEILSSLAAGIIGNVGEAKGSLTALTDPGGPLASALQGFTNNNPAPPSTKPKAFLNYVFFDEQFNRLSNSGSIPVNQPDILESLAVTNLVAAKNGFVYIYVSNETQNWDVFFDNLQVLHTAAPLLEETHYYPFGLTMAGISSKAIGKYDNKYKFNSATELTADFNLNFYKTEFRLYDPQLGRFLQMDLLGDLAMDFSNYAFGNNNPLRYNDPLGLISTPENPDELAPVYVTAKAKSKNPLNNLDYEGVTGWLDRQRELGYSDDQISSYLDQQKVDNGAWRKFNAAMSPASTRIREAEKASWEAQGEIAAFIGYGIIPAGPIGGLVGKAGAKIINIVAKTGGKALRLSAKGGKRYLYHYTSEEAADAITQEGLRVGRDGFSYLTNKSNLSGLQAQIELALPANRALPNSVLRIDVSGLTPAMVRRVTGNLSGMGAGGGKEFLFNQHIPANLISKIK